MTKQTKIPRSTLRLPGAGQTPRSLIAFANRCRLCDEPRAGRHEIGVIDFRKHPESGRVDQVGAPPGIERFGPPKPP